MTDNIEREKFVEFAAPYLAGSRTAAEVMWDERKDWAKGWQARAALSQPAAGGAVGDRQLVKWLEKIRRDSHSHDESDFITSIIAKVSVLRATAAPDESRDIEMIEYAIDNRMLSAEQILAAFNESRKR